MWIRTALLPMAGLLAPILLAPILLAQISLAQSSSNPEGNPGIELTRRALNFRVEQIEKANDLHAFGSQELWSLAQESLRKQLAEMLGLPPLESRPSPLQAVTTGTLEHEDLIVEKIHFQSSPGLYVTGNLYRPKRIDQPLPAILYVCGHGQVKENGVSLGNKTHYQHHPAWFARQGYIAMAIDTIQLGEIEGIHHGLHRYNRWDWPSRGYTPAGVETWNAIRAVDYLVSRPDVDASKIGITGRSGGGAYSWYAAAIDTRIRVAVPVAGVTDLRDQIIDQVVRGHCDCMFFNNRYGWDYTTLCAMVHPRALLIGNTDEDPIFPLRGVFRVQQQMRTLYALESKSNLGIHWTTGGHEDTQELQLGCFVWFDRHLLGTPRKLQRTAEPLFAKADLKVFGSNPSDQRVTDVQDWFVPIATSAFGPGDQLPKDPASWDLRCEAIRNEISESVHGRLPGFPSQDLPAGAPDATNTTNTNSFAQAIPKAPAIPKARKAQGRLELIETQARVSQGDWEVTQFECKSDSIPCATLLRIRAWAHDESIDPAVQIVCADESLWKAWATTTNPQSLESQNINGDGLVKGQILGEAWRTILAQASANQTTYLVFPEGRGPWAWDTTDKIGLHWRRSYLLAGWSLEGRQVAGITKSIEAVLAEHRIDQCRLKAGAQMSVHALHAALLSPDQIESLELHSLDPDAYSKGFVLIGILRFCELSDVLAAVSSQIPTKLRNAAGYRKLPLFQHLENRLSLKPLASTGP